MKLFQRIKEFLKNNGPKISLTFDDERLCDWLAGAVKGQFRWDSVLEIFAFKRDMLTYDLICIGFRIANDGKYFEIDEDMKGYEEVTEFLMTRFDGINKDWFYAVAFPAFETNFVSLWGEPMMKKI